MAQILTPSEGTDNGPRRTSVYRYYDEQGALIYVGITNRGTLRNREHNADKDWWRFVVRQEVEHYDDRPAAARREKELIHRYRPPFNRQHNPDSESLRNAYLTYRALAAEGDPLDLGRQLGRILPLEVAGYDDESHLILRTLPEHSAIACRLMDAEGITVQGTGRGAGRALSMVRHGPIALLAVSKRPIRQIEEAWATFKFPKARPVGSLVQLTSINLRLEPLDPRLPICRRKGCDAEPVALGRCAPHAVEMAARQGGAA